MHSQLLDSFLKQNYSGLPVKDFLQQVLEEHPYFSPAQFFLLQQLNDTGTGYAAQAAKTALLFNNPHWLQFKLHQAATMKQAPVVPMYAENTDNDDDNAELLENQEDAPATDTIVTNSDALLTTEAAAAIDETNSDNDDDNAVLVNNNSTVITKTEAEHTPVAAEAPAQEEQHNMPIPEFKLDLAAPAAIDENTPAFEPMHLVDYFASQGIKLSEELQTGDKLGKQLKSFTEWLKTMKKVHAAEAAGNGGNTDVAVQALAEKSNANNEILTEAMAQVFLQQGKRAKAIELYEKLSLLNPAKSAYFAAQIEKLKG